jgi:hypothetical protein
MSGPARLGLAARTPEPRGRSDATLEDDMLHRLALWLADVSAESAPAQIPQEAGAAPRPTPRRSRVAEASP